MPDHDLEKLLGGFAADTLTAEEKHRLYQAALQDQKLFTALADEQALKELLIDPIVREKLLQTLRKDPSASHGTASWLDWFRRPAGLAWAGGLAAAVFAVVLGTRIYQESVKEAGRSVATEAVRPVAPPAAGPSTSRSPTPPINELESRANENVGATATSPQHEAPAGKAPRRETTTTTKPERRTQDSVGDRKLQRPEHDALRKRAEPTTDKLAQSKEDAPTSVDHKRVTPSSPAPTSVPVPMQATTGAAMADQAGSSLSARSLFYAEAPRSEATLKAEQKERSEKPLAESSQHSVQSERKVERFAAAKHKGLDTSILPLGIRYSIQTDGTADQNPERTAGSTDQVRQITMTIESNQDGYLQIWEQAETLSPHRLFPSDPNGQPSSRLAAHERVNLSFQATFSTLVIRFSRAVANGVEPVMSDRFAHNQLRELVPSKKEEDGAQEQTTYVVNQDPSLSEIVVRIPIQQP